MGILVKAVDKKTAEVVGYLGFKRDEYGNLIQSYEITDDISYTALWNSLDTLATLLSNLPPCYANLKFTAEWDGRGEDLTKAFDELEQRVKERKESNMKNTVNTIIDTDYYEIPAEVSKTEMLIFDWVAENFGIQEAVCPSWNPTALAKYIEDNISNKDYKQKYTVRYEL